jgi:hypothetical protein
MMLSLRDDQVLSRRMRMIRDSLRAVADLDIVLTIANPDLITRILPRNGVAAPLPRDISITGHLPQLIITVRIGWPARNSLQAELFSILASVHLFSRGSVHTLVGDRPHPRRWIPSSCFRRR